MLERRVKDLENRTEDLVEACYIHGGLLNYGKRDRISVSFALIKMMSKLGLKTKYVPTVGGYVDIVLTKEEKIG